MRVLVIALTAILIGGCATAPRKGVPVPHDVDLTELKSFEIPAAEIDPEHHDSLKAHLARFGLVPVKEDNSDQFTDRYRFLWRRWLAAPALFEIRFDKSGHGQYQAMIWGEKNGVAGWQIVKTSSLGSKDRDGFHMMTERWKLFDVPWFDSRFMLDGSSWFLELQEGKRFHQIFRESPECNEVRRFGEFLIQMGIDSPFVPMQ